MSHKFHFGTSRSRTTTPLRVILRLRRDDSSANCTLRATGTPSATSSVSLRKIRSFLTCYRLVAESVAHSRLRPVPALYFRNVRCIDFLVNSESRPHQDQSCSAKVSHFDHISALWAGREIPIKRAGERIMIEVGQYKLS